MPNIPHDRTYLLQKLRSLPQAGVITDDTRQSWLDHTLLVDPERVEWHIARASGFGGSEAGFLLEWATRDDPRPVTHTSWGSIERLIRQKLLLLAPDAPTIDTLRGQALEPLIGSLFDQFLDRSGHSWRRREDIQHIIEDGPHPRLPWIRASLDAVYEIDGKLWLVDFKAPSEHSLDKHREQLSMGYIAQLNHYALVARGKGIAIHGLGLAMFDYRRYAKDPIAFFPVEHSGAIQARLSLAGRDLWENYVMRGYIPQLNRNNSVTPNQDIIELLKELKDVSQKINALTKQKEKVRSQLLDYMTAMKCDRLAVDWEDGKAHVSIRRSLDEERVWDRLASFCETPAAQDALRRDLFQFRLRDPEAAVRWLKDMRETLSQIAPQDIPAPLQSFLFALPEMAEGALHPESARQALIAIGENPEDYETATLYTRF